MGFFVMGGLDPFVLNVCKFKLISEKSQKK